MSKFGLGLLVSVGLLAGLSCTATRRFVPVTFRVSVGKKTLPNPRSLASTDMGCFFVSVTASDIAGSLTAGALGASLDVSCLDLGQISDPVPLSTAQSGITLRVKTGKSRLFHVYGLYGVASTSCNGVSLADLLDANPSAALYELGSTQADVVTDATVAVQDSFASSSQTDLIAKCKGSGTSTISTRTFLYAPESMGSQLDMYEVNESSGQLTPIGTQALTGGAQPYAVCTDPGHQVIATVDSTNGKVYVFTVGKDGTLTAFSNSPFVTGDSNPMDCAFTPDGKFLIIAHYTATGSIASIGVDDSAKSLFAVAGSPFSVTPSSGYPLRVTTSPDSGYTYLTTLSDSKIYGYSIMASGALSPLGYTATNQAPTALVFHPTANFLYGVQNSSAQSGYYTYNSSTGALGSENLLTPASGEHFKDACITPDGKYLYGTSTTTSPFDTVVRWDVQPNFSINTTAMSTVQTFSSQTGSYLYCSIAVAGKFFYASRIGTNEIYAYAINGTGGLDPISGSPYSTGTNAAYRIGTISIPQ